MEGPPGRPGRRKKQWKVDVTPRGGGRQRNAEIAQDTLRLLAEGGYEEEAKASRMYTEENEYVLPTGEAAAAAVETEFCVSAKTTLEALYEEERARPGSVAVLNFASAKNPGGGFKKGSSAQEESLARLNGALRRRPGCVKGRDLR